MMTKRGHTVYLYAARENDAECAELVPCAPQPRSNKVTEPVWTQDYFSKMNNRVIKAMRSRLDEHDFICLIGGICQQPIAEAFPAHTAVEFGVGYQGTFAKYRVFESYAWMHAVYGHQQGAMGANGHFYDCVIPNYFEVDQFPEGKGDGGYLLYVGRLIERKGLQVVVDTATRADLPLVIAGQGEPPDYGEYVGVVGPERRAELMGGAIALLCPTLYVEPFGGVNVEAQICGTPAISTDWGAFTETVEQGVTGFRCRTLDEFAKAAIKASKLNRKKVRQRAIELYSTDAVAMQYEVYFRRLLALWNDGWYT
jgi:glycosyltransferase involved in cell wall biosynthesis